MSNLKGLVPPGTITPTLTPTPMLAPPPGLPPSLQIDLGTVADDSTLLDYLLGQVSRLVVPNASHIAQLDAFVVACEPFGRTKIRRLELPTHRRGTRPATRR